MLNAGSAYLFRFDGVAFTGEEKIVPWNDSRSEYFGTSVSVAAQTILVGAPYHTQAGMQVGAVYIIDATK